MRKEEIIKKYNSILSNAKANWIYEDYEILLNFLDLYNKEKENNEYLRNHIYNPTVVKLNYIHKDKIREKIEKIDIAISSCEYADDDNEEIKKTIEGEKYLLLRDKAILKQLLEE